MSETTFKRNRNLLKAYCEGAMVEDLCEQYSMTKPLLDGAMRQALTALKEHTDYDGEVSFHKDIFLKNKAAILKYLKVSIPKVSLTTTAKQALKEAFGERYGQHPEKVYQGWGDFELRKSPYRHYRDLESIRTWLATEGFFVDDFLDQAMIDTTFKQMLTALKAIPSQNTISIDVTQGSADRRVMYFNADVTQGEHQAKRRFKLELLPAY